MRRTPFSLVVCSRAHSLWFSRRMAHAERSAAAGGFLFLIQAVVEAQSAEPVIASPAVGSAADSLPALFTADRRTSRMQRTWIGRSSLVRACRGGVSVHGR